MWPNPHQTADLVPFTEETLHGKLHFLCSDESTKLPENRNVKIAEKIKVSHDNKIYYGNLKSILKQKI